MAASLPTASAGNPFLLPVCSCGGPMNLASLEPHPTRADQELKTFKCLHCGKQHVFTVQKRRGRSPTTRADFGGA
jgi:hypothetical protein